MMNGFAKGVIVGSIIGASVSMLMESGMIKRRHKRKMLRAGRNFLRRTGTVVGDIIDVLR